MKSKVKNIAAVIVIILLICVAAIVPMIFNIVFDRRIDKKVKYIEDEIYSVEDGQEKSVSKKMEELSQCVTGRKFETVYIPIYINDAMYQKVEKEYRKWRMIINQNVDILKTKFNLERDIALSSDVTLYWEYNTNISFYAFTGAVKDKTQDEAYEVTLYVDKDTCKILYMSVINFDLRQKVEDFWESGDMEKYQHNGPEKEGKNNISNFLKEYYNIPEKDFQTGGEYFYGAKMFGELEWSISETGDGGLEFGVDILNDELVYGAKYYEVNVKSNTALSE